MAKGMTNKLYSRFAITQVRSNVTVHNSCSNKCLYDHIPDYLASERNPIATNSAQALSYIKYSRPWQLKFSRHRFQPILLSCALRSCLLGKGMRVEEPPRLSWSNAPFIQIVVPRKQAPEVNLNCRRRGAQGPAMAAA